MTLLENINAKHKRTRIDKKTVFVTRAIRKIPIVKKPITHECKKRDCYYCQHKYMDKPGSIKKLISVLNMRGVHESAYEYETISIMSGV